MKTLKVGDKAPNFEALDQDGNTIKLSDYKGKKLVLFFYPKASTPGCTMEACNLRDNYNSFLAKGFDVLGVSADSAKRQQNFIHKNELPFPNSFDRISIENRGMASMQASDLLSFGIPYCIFRWLDIFIKNFFCD